MDQNFLLDDRRLDEQILDGVVLVSDTIFSVEIGGSKVPIFTDTLSVEDEVEQRSLASFTVKDLDNSYSFQKGEPVTIRNNYIGVTIYKGYVSTSEKRPISTTGEYSHVVKATDMHYLADKRRVAYANTNTLAGTVAKDLVDNTLTEEGVSYTADSIQDGEQLTSIIFNYIPADKALDELAESQNFWWKIDQDKVLHFKPKGADTVGFTLERKNVLTKPSVKTGNPQYRNRQYVKGPIDKTNSQTEKFHGDGESRSFSVGYPIIEGPTVEVDRGSGYSIETTAKKGSDTTSQWYWAKRDNTLKQDIGETTLTSTDTLKVTYIGMFKIVVLARDPDEVDAQKAIEGDTSGKVENTVTRPDIEGRDTAIEVGNAKISRYAKDSKLMSYKTLKRGMEAGEVQPVSGFTGLGITDGEKLLIRSITAKPKKNVMIYQVEAVKGPKHESWQKIFGQIKGDIESAIEVGVSTGQILTLTYNFSKTWSQPTSPNPFHDYYADGTYTAGDGRYPMLGPNNVVKYIAWFDSGGSEIGRKAVSQEDIESGHIYTLTYINSGEANVDWYEVGWFGGYRATDTVGTGVLLDKQTHEVTKNKNEAWQMKKDDYKGW